jgi:hypothetical protein
MSSDTPARRVSCSQNLLQIEKDDALRSYKIATDHPISAPPHSIQAHPGHKNQPPQRYRCD